MRNTDVRTGENKQAALKHERALTGLVLHEYRISDEWQSTLLALSLNKNQDGAGLSCSSETSVSLVNIFCGCAHPVKGVGF